MHYLTFVGRVARLTGTAEDRAATLTRATLETLAERLTGGEVLDLAAQLPKPLWGLLSPHPRTEAAERFGAAEFVARVARRADCDENTARTAVGAVFATLREAISSGEFQDVVVQLPRDYRDMVEPALAPAATRRR
ncbi:DUF2267 domain-containing protein [Micromonospora sp. WMMA1998]|uniref:Uncharacterized conserved protein, DUF2267 family n=1 Tax=Micromonospora sediminicola TaxID=946078 RepID=A0A1A9BDD1_9ACTN|nr:MULTISPECIES: DUF2267 domain-containing protein [Micromonospora]ATO13512.1 DUF2267 domain-containing protein [Micromonospora sp. WMMA2032]PGH45229.1 DUF2267 domain-containing protein [Micromonospora sp. WMMA1996]WBC15583.1 DUF2267 domain-containing protein [Micromonospora sp. WMMA1998]SBT67101.1 Uncharacterized conserved protein, DUF2267 family [Micromonospora sediminicola]